LENRDSSIKSQQLLSYVSKYWTEIVKKLETEVFLALMVIVVACYVGLKDIAALLSKITLFLLLF